MSEPAVTLAGKGNPMPGLDSLHQGTCSGVSLLVKERAGINRLNEPVSLGIPFPVGRVSTSSGLQLSDPAGQRVPCQTRELAHWADGSVKWLLCTFLANAEAMQTVEYQLEVNPEANTAQVSSEWPVVQVENSQRQVAVNTGKSRFRLALGDVGLIAAAEIADSALRETGFLRVMLRDAQGQSHIGLVERITVQESGPVRASAMLHGSFGRRCRLRYKAKLNFFAGSNQVHVAVTLMNRGRAKHGGGYWDLGDPGSVLFKGLALELSLPSTGGERSVAWNVDRRSTVCALGDVPLEIYQESSGGENWQSRNHLNRNGEIPLGFQGYRIRQGEKEQRGLRANPTVAVQGDSGAVGIAPLEFWENFPSAVTVSDSEFRWEPFPSQFSDLHELQAGEYSTRTAWLDFGPVGADICQGLAWTHMPVEVRSSSQVYANSGAIPNLPDENTPLRPELTTLLSDALEGPRNFFRKREVVDEYGWRHFGDLWADHEEVHYPGPHQPIISHYNNQFDVLHGLLVEYLRSGDQRWWQLADPLARHVIDIDIYHTDRDRAAYNGGLFWPTNHYYDAGTSTHRSMARQMSETGRTGIGGGPGNEHNYTSGLLLYHYLTGDETARDTVIALADWVIAMDDGAQHFLSVLSGSATGIATVTSEPNYHGPGRGPANSLQALVDGYLATDHEKYLIKADEVIRRTIHPKDPIEERQLENAELRWSYTMHLQSLVRYYETIPRRPSTIATLRYVKESVLHYARWMAAQEQFHLDHPEKLEFPTETWAAQELRKGTVLLMAARLAQSEERIRFRQRGQYFLDRGWKALLAFPTRAYTRPLALVLGQGYIEAALAVEHAELLAEESEEMIDPGMPEAFVSQKQDVRKSLSSAAGLVRIMGRCACPARWKNLLGRSWVAERIRTALHCNGE
ncbi:MAG: hypothetical protein K8T91_02715 [Planctomycetes bacterium]|nr:hypothetical protein [Planctomycetota bacterium]